MAQRCTIKTLTLYCEEAYKGVLDKMHDNDNMSFESFDNIPVVSKRLPHATRSIVKNAKYNDISVNGTKKASLLKEMKFEFESFLHISCIVGFKKGMSLK